MCTSNFRPSALQDVTRRLRDAERALSKVVASRAMSGDGAPDSVPGSPGPGDRGSTDDRSVVVDELMRRMRLRERELSEANAKIEMLVSEKKRPSTDAVALGLGGVMPEDSSLSVGSLSGSGASTAASSASTQVCVIRVRLLSRSRGGGEFVRAWRCRARDFGWLRWYAEEEPAYWDPRLS